MERGRPRLTLSVVPNRGVRGAPMRRSTSGPQHPLSLPLRGTAMGEFLQLLVDRIDTPIGELMVVADRGGNLRAVDWAGHEHRMRRLLRLHYGEDGFKLEPNRNPIGSPRAIASYFAGWV